MLCGVLLVRASTDFLLNRMETKMAGTGKSTMVHQFSQVPRAQIPRSSFDRSHGLKTTFNESVLVPIFVDEVLPGDTFNLRSTLFGRFSTPIFPIMDNVYLDVFYFFVPYRLIWTHFVNFFGEQANPTDTTSYLVPTCAAPAAGYGENTLQDYMGLPTKVNALTHSNLPFRAYNLIWNQWFRDQNLQNSVTVDMGDGPDTYTNYVLLSRGKRHDYFTSCLPWPSKGPAVQLPLGSTAPITGMAIRPTNVAAAAGVASWDFETGSGTYGSAWDTSTVEIQIKAQSNAVPSTSNKPQVFADLSTATAATINQLRQAFQIQKIYERDARGGTRYTELIRAHFGVTSPDARLQRAEYLGGGSVQISINPIAQTTGTGASGTTTPLGNLGAMGTVHHNGVGFTKSFTEHGVLLGLVNLRADINYQDGLERMWSRSTRFDFYWPALSQIGEQAVLNGEIYAVGAATPGQDALTFGYQERYAEYRYKLSKICGQFRSNCVAPLDSWHLAQHYTALPLLNSAFITDSPPVSRVVAVSGQPRVLLDVYHNLRCARPMPVYSVPGLIDHF